MLVSVEWENADETRVYTLEDYVDPDSVHDPYTKSKIYAEKAAWKFMATLEDSERFEFISLVPCFITGPTLIKTSFSTGDLFVDIMSGKFPRYPEMNFASIDV